MNPITGRNLVWLTLSLSLGIFMNVLDISIANVSIPTIAGDMGVSPDQGTWIITSFSVSTAIMLPLTGWLSRRFGEVRLFVYSTALFTAASFMCGISTNLTMLIICRVIQGAVAGPMIPLSQGLLLSSYPDEKKGFATSLWVMVAVVAPICGPVLGGWITDNYSWPWIFYINIPVGIFSVIVTAMMLKGRDTPIVKAPIDYIGIILLVVGIGCLQVLLDQGHDLDWFHSTEIVTLGVVSLISLVFFVVWELTEKYPIVDLTLFARRNFAIGTICITLGFLIYFSNVVIFPLWLQTQMNYTPTWAGLAAAPTGVFPLFFSVILGLFIHKVDLRFLVSLGFMFFAISAFWNGSFTTQVDYFHLILPRFLQGVGVALFFTPLISIVLAGMPKKCLASALGLSNFCRILGGSFGTSISVTMWDNRAIVHHADLVEGIRPNNPNVGPVIDRLHSIGFDTQTAYDIIDRNVINQSFMLSTNDLFYLAGWIFVGLMVLVWFAKPPFITNGAAHVAD